MKDARGDCQSKPEHREAVFLPEFASVVERICDEEEKATHKSPDSHAESGSHSVPTKPHPCLHTVPPQELSNPHPFPSFHPEFLDQKKCVAGAHLE